MGENLDSLFNLPGRYDELSSGLQKRLQDDFSHFGLGLMDLYITSITPPPEVQKAIDDKSRLGVIQDLDSFIKMKAASAMEKAAESARAAGERALQDARPHLLSSLQWINAEMKKVISRLEQEEPET